MKQFSDKFYSNIQEIDAIVDMSDPFATIYQREHVDVSEFQEMI